MSPEEARPSRRPRSAALEALSVVTGVAMSWPALALDLASNDRRYLSIGSMAKVGGPEGGNPAMFRKRTWLSMLTVTVLVLTISWVGIPGAAAAVPRCSGKKATIVGTDHADVLKGTSGRDVIVGLGGADTIEGLRGDDFICGGLGDDTILGSRGGDFIKGGGGNDVIDAGPGFDWLYGDPGDDQLDGGPGLGLLDFSTAPGPVTVDLLAGTAFGWDSDTVAGIATVWGSDFDDVLSGSDAGGPEGLYETFVGFAGDDVLSGLGGDDSFQGGEGNDSIDGGDGNDFIEGGPGDDQIEGGLGFDWLDLQQAPGPLSVDLSAGTASGEGTDSLSGVEAVFGSAFDDTLTGDEVRNQLYGECAVQCLCENEPCPFGNDTIHGGGGDDFVAGGYGDDQLFGEDGNDELDGWQGDDYLDGGPGTDTLYAGAGTDTCVNGEDNTDCEA